MGKNRIDNAARMRLKRAQETPEARAERQRKQSLYARKKRAEETPEQVALRRFAQRTRARLRRSRETEEERELRKERERLRTRERRAAMPLEKRESIKEAECLRKRLIRQKAKLNLLMQSPEYQSSITLPNSDQCSYIRTPMFDALSPTFRLKLDNSNLNSNFGTIAQLKQKNKSYEECNTKVKKKRGRPCGSGKKLVKTEFHNIDEGDFTSSCDYESMTSKIRMPYLPEHHPNFRNEKEIFDESNDPCQMNSLKDIVHDFLKCNAIIQENTFHEIKQELETNGGETNEKNLNIGQNAPHLSNGLEESLAGMIKLEPEIIEDSFIRNITQNQNLKMEKIKKLLERMSEKD